MMSLLPPPKKRQRFFNESNQHKFPVPVESETGVPATSAAWHYYKAVWKDGKVTVPDPHHAEALWSNGYFGVGSLSSSGMSYMANCDILTEKRLRRKEEWSNTSFDEESVINTDSENNSSQKDFKSVLVVDKKEYNTDNVCAQFEEDPFPIKEPMELTKEEALYLSYALGCLVVSMDEDREMDVDDLWTAFMEIDKAFFLRYVVYHYLRSKGWVVKPGTKLGVDWITYPTGPPYYHSQFMVCTRCTWADTLETDQTISKDFTMTEMCSFERLANQVAKSVVLCDIVRPRELTDDCLSNINCVTAVKVVMSYIAKWNPEEERT